MAFRKSLAQCLACELRLVNGFIVIVGFLMQGVGFFLLIADPLTGVADIGDVVHSYLIKVIPFILGMALMLAGFIGMRFVAKRRTSAAIAYFTFLTLVLITEVTGGWFFSSTMREMESAKTYGGPGGEANPEKWNGWMPNGDYYRRRAMSRVFFSFAKRFNDVNKTNCQLLPEAPINVTTGNKTQRWHAPCDTQVITEVKCDKRPNWAALMEERCVPKTEGNSGGTPEEWKTEYKKDCDLCLSNYYEHWIAGTKTEATRNGTDEDLHALWHSDASLAWCRCLGRQIDAWTRHFQDLWYGIQILSVIQVIIIITASYVYCCATKSELDEEDDSSDEDMAYRRSLELSGVESVQPRPWGAALPRPSNR